MKPATVGQADLSDALEAIRQELARLGERVTALEAATGLKPRAATAPVAAKAEACGSTFQTCPTTNSPAAVKAEGLSEELVLVLSAAVAAFLGKKPHIRQIRLLGSTAWAQQGRVTIQASHALTVKHG